MHDCIIVGGGPAGLQAALILGRCLRNVVICDNGMPRNLYSHELHAFPTRDNIAPSEFLLAAHKDLLKYKNISFIKQEVSSVSKTQNGFSATLSDGKILESKSMLIATGVVDEVPLIEGFMECYGKTIFHCPYCDGWEHRDQPLAIYGKNNRIVEFAITLYQWSKDLVLCTDGRNLTYEQIKKLSAVNIEVKTEKILKFDAQNGKLQNIVFKNGERLKRTAMFFNTHSYIRTKLLEDLGCPFDQKNGVPTGKYERTEVPGLFVAGNILREVQLVIVAAAEGAEAAFGINKFLNKLK